MKKTDHEKELLTMARKKRAKATLPNQHVTKLGSMNIVKGSVGGGDINYTWDTVSECRLENCPAATRCHYLDGMSAGEECKIMKKYLRAVSMILYDDHIEISAAQRLQIGMHIIPLYKTLCKMKIEEVGIVSALHETSRSTLQVNPVYKEIREIIKVIDNVWKSIGVKPVRKVGEPDFGAPISSASNYYDEMEKESFANVKGKVTRLKRRER